MENTERDDDMDIQDEDENDEPDYYYCYCCGYNCSVKTYERLGTWGCPRCTAEMSPEYY